MREIKFRAWFEKGNKMFNVDVLAISPCTWDCPDYGKRGVSLAYQPSIKVMQYTGLKDKNGKEIYEGDIVCDRWANFYTPIFRNGIYMAYNVKDLHLTKQEPSTQFNVIWKNGCEVIGNIHDNPELLGESHED